MPASLKIFTIFLTDFLTMKRLLILSAAISLFASCEREPQNLQPVFTGTNIVEGEWTLKIHNDDTVLAPKAGSLKLVATSDTSGTADLDITEDGNSNNVEHAIYDLKTNKATIYFSRTLGGNSGILVHGEKWKIDKMILHDDNKPDTFALHSDVTGEKMLLTKP
jgi:hypothetical protein